MARREPNTTEVLEVSIMFDPSHGASACIAEAYERVVPIMRRAAPSPQHPGHAGRERLTQQVGGAHA